MTRTTKQLESLAGIEVTKPTNLTEAGKLDMDRVKKGIAASMKKNDMRAVTKVAKEVLRDGGQKAFDEIMDYIGQLAR